jgi:hypothetical protein
MMILNNDENGQLYKAISCLIMGTFDNLWIFCGTWPLGIENGGVAEAQRERQQ